MSKGLVYILTNPCLDGWVKIGMTEKNDVEQRVKELSSPTNMPLSFRCYAVYEVDSPREVEKQIHNIIDLIDESLHAKELLDNGKVKTKEFFKMSPEAAFGVFKAIASLRGDSDKLKPYIPTAAQIQEQEYMENKKKSVKTTFNLLNLSVGETIAFLYDDRITAIVADDKNRIEYENSMYSVSALAAKLLHERNGWAENVHVNGWRFFTKDGMTLSDLREVVESSAENEE